jgi:hypothetical protein
MPHSIRDWYRNRRAQRRAEAVYTERSLATSVLLDSLADVGDHDARHGILIRCATNIREMRRVFPTAFGATADPDPRSPMQLLAAEAICLRLIADVELVLAYPQTRRCRRDTTTHLEATAGPVLDWAVAAGRLDRAVLTEMADAVQPVVGAMVADLVARLPIPTHRSDFHPAG